MGGHRAADPLGPGSVLFARAGGRAAQELIGDKVMLSAFIVGEQSWRAWVRTARTALLPGLIVAVGRAGELRMCGQDCLVQCQEVEKTLGRLLRCRLRHHLIDQTIELS